MRVFCVLAFNQIHCATHIHDATIGRLFGRAKSGRKSNTATWQKPITKKMLQDAMILHYTCTVY